MAISSETEAKILRYYHVEKWRVGTISRELSVHHCVVKRVLSQSGAPKNKVLRAPSMIDPYLPFVLKTLQDHPKLTASSLYGMVQARGYLGGIDHFRHLISFFRPKPLAEAYLRLRTLPGEQAQVDWGHFGTITIGQAQRKLNAFVMVLSYSRQVFLHFYLNQQMCNFLRGHVAAFESWGGVPRVLLYDNLKSAVLERSGDAIRFNQELLDFSAHYRFEPRPVAVARGNEKGRVERAIRYVRDSFFAGRKWESIDELNEQAAGWCNGTASSRPCPENKSKSVRETFKEEEGSLIKLPDNPYPTAENETVKVGKTPYVRFDLNDYSVPHIHVGRSLTVHASLETISILDGIEIIAEHQRCYDKAQQIEDSAHVDELIKRKKRARLHHGQNYLSRAVPVASSFLKKAAERGYHLGSITKSLLLLLEDYGSADLDVAIKEALAKDVPHPNAVRNSLIKRREQRQQLPPVRLDLPNDVRVREQVVRPHDLKDYDQLGKTKKEGRKS